MAPRPPGGTGPGVPQASPAPPLPTAAPGVSQSTPANIRVPTQGVPRFNVSMRETMANFGLHDRHHLAMTRFLYNNYFEYHRMGHTWGVSFEDKAQPWWKAVSAPDSHWALYEWKLAERPYRLNGPWDTIYRTDLRKPNLTAQEHYDIRRKARYRIPYQLGRTNSGKSSIPSDAHARLQNAINRANIRIKVLRVFSAGGQASFPDPMLLKFATGLLFIS